MFLNVLFTLLYIKEVHFPSKNDLNALYTRLQSYAFFLNGIVFPIVRWTNYGE